MHHANEDHNGPEPLELADVHSTSLATAVSQSPGKPTKDEEEPSIDVESISETKSQGLSRWKAAVVITCVTFSSGIATFLSGIVIIAIPTITTDLHLSASMALWPVTMYSLTCGCTLLICGSISDVIGSRQAFLLGCFLQCAFTLGCGLSNTGVQLIVLRALSGIAASFCLPSAVSLINEVFVPGRSRNIAFASMGGAQPVGFGLGLTLGGVFTGSIGWQWGFHTAAITNLFMCVAAAWQLPQDTRWLSKDIWSRLAREIDWVGAITVSVALAMLSYVISALTDSPTKIEEPLNISLLILAFVFFLAFVLWVGRQERLGRPALIPNSLWRNKVFSSICINVFCVWAAFNAFEQYINYFFQDVQHISPMGAALRFIPAPVSGALTNVVVGLIVHRVRGDAIVILTAIPTAIGSLLMAVADPKWSYWSCAFIANTLNPIGADGVFTVSNLLITSMFPEKTQGVAGGVFNTVSQTGKNVGVALTALVANQVTHHALSVHKPDPSALLDGIRAAFWFCVALTAVSLLVSVWGLRTIGKVGQKRD